MGAQPEESVSPNVQEEFLCVSTVIEAFRFVFRFVLGFALEAQKLFLLSPGLSSGLSLGFEFVVVLELCTL